MNKRGQVFLISALIIIGVIIGLARISNQGTSKKEPEAFFDLSDEISFETKRVLDFGIINGTGTNVSGLASQLLDRYSENIAKNDVAFVYGDTSSNIYAYYYNTTTINAITLFNGISQRITLSTGNVIGVNYTSSTNKATINIEGVDYTFDLKQGQNFYFVISKEEDGEKFVTIK